MLLSDIRPTMHFEHPDTDNVFNYVQSAIYILPWIFGTDYMIYDSLFWLLLNIIFIMTFCFTSYRAYKKKYVPFYLLVWMRVFPQYIVPLFSLPLFFRISLMIENIYTKREYEYVIGLALYILNFIIFIIFQYIASVFLIPFCFVWRSKLDVYDGKSHLLFYLFNAIFSISYLLVPIWGYYQYSGLLFIVYLLFLAVLVYFRLLTNIHVSLIAQFLELAPFFSLPFMILYRLYGEPRWSFYLILLVILNLVFFFILNLTKRLTKHISYQILGSFIYNDSSSLHLPKFIPGNMCSAIRVLYHYNSDPNILLRLLDNQKQTHLKTSILIEISRFLSIFPENRQDMLDEIENATTNSTYNRYTLYIFKKILKSLLKKKLEEKYLFELDRIYTSYIVHFYLYWNARKDKKYAKAFFEATAAANFFLQGRGELKKLLYRFPQCANIHKIYGEMLLNLDGDFEKYKRQNALSRAIEKDPESIIDPLLHSMISINPRILQFCFDNNKFSSSSSSTTGINVTLTKTETITSFFTRSHRKNSKKKSSIASKIKKSKRKIPYGYFINFFIPILIASVFVTFAFQFENSIVNSRNDLLSYINRMIQSLYTAVAAIFIPTALAGVNEGDLTQIDSCRIEFMTIPNLVNDFFVNSPLISYLNEIVLVLTYQEMNSMLVSAANICELLYNLPSTMEILAISQLNNILEEKRTCTESIIDLSNRISKMYYFTNFVYLGAIIMVVVLFLYFFSSCLTFNLIMNNNQKAIDFFSSKERLKTIMQDNVRENAWEQLKEFASSSLNASDSYSQIRIESESEFESKQTSVSIESDISESEEKSNRYPSIVFKKNANIAKFSSSVNLSVPNKIGITASFTGSGLNVMKQPKAFIIDHSNETEIDENSSDVKVPLSLASNSISNTQSNSQLNLKSSDSGGHRKRKLGDSQLVSLADNHSNSQMNLLSSSHNFSPQSTQEGLDNLIQIKSLEDKCSPGYVMMSMIIPWMIIFVFVALSYFPLNKSKEFRLDSINSTNLIDKHMTATLNLLNETFYLLNSGEINIQTVSEVEQILINENSDISHLYNIETCYDYTEYICISIGAIVHQILGHDPSNNFLQNVALPAIVAFTETSMTSYFAPNLSGIAQMKVSDGISFLVSFYIIVIVILIVGIINTLLVQRGFNSLYHFPDVFSKKEKRKKEIGIKVKKVKRFPTNIILVTSVTETDEIYSISDNCLAIINKGTSEMICKKLSKAFSVIGEKGGFQIRECNGKTFISRSQKIGVLTKTILIETTKIEMKSKGFNVIQKLINFIPSYFAKPFSDELIKTYHFDKSVLIFIRMNPNAGQLEKFFTCIDNQIQMYYNIDLIRTNGSILTCICKEVDSLEILLFLRDVIQESLSSCRNQMSNFGLMSIYIGIANELNFEITEGSELYAKFKEEIFKQYETTTYEIDTHYIAGSKGTVMFLDKIKPYTTVKKTSNGSRIRVISFDTFTKEVANQILN